MSHFKSNLDYLSRLPSELLDDIFHLAHDSSQPLPAPLSKTLLPFQRRQLFRLIEVTSYQSLENLCTTAQTDPNVPLYIEDLDVRLKFSRLSGWNAQEAEDPGYPSNVKIARFLKQMSSVRMVNIIGSARITLAFLSPTVTPSLTSLESLNIVSTLHTLSDPFSPTNFAGLRSCSQFTSLGLNVYHDSQACPAPTQPPLDSVSFESQLTYVQLSGHLSSNVESVRRLLSSFVSPSILFLFDATKTSSVLPNLLAALRAPEKVGMLVLNIAPQSDSIILGDLPHQLKAFTSLMTLTLLSDFTSLTSSLSANLHTLPIVCLQFGMTASVALSQLKLLVSGPTKHRTLDSITLDQVEGKIGTKIEEAGKPFYDIEEEQWAVYPDWILPKWTEEFSEEGLVEMVEVAKKEGIAIEGSAVDAIGIMAQFEREWELLEEYELEDEEEEEESE